MAFTKKEDKTLERFLHAQNGVGRQISYDLALSEIIEGRKKSHWIWYVFPQFLDPNRSSANNTFYQLHDRNEVFEYLSHPLLRRRIEEISVAVTKGLQMKSPRELMSGVIDAKKLHQSMSTFYLAACEMDGEEELVGLFGGILDVIHRYQPEEKREDVEMRRRWFQHHTC